MPEHKLQSSEGAPSVQLQLVPKMLKPLVKNWVPNAFVVSFKLETDPKILILKAEKALKTYGHSLVIANILETRKEKVVLIAGVDDNQEILLKDEKTEIEDQIIDELKLRHDNFKNK